MLGRKTKMSVEKRNIPLVKSLIIDDNYMINVDNYIINVDDYIINVDD